MNDQNTAAIRAQAGLATPMTLRVAVTLALPDRLRAAPATTDQLATELNTSPAALHLLLSHLSTLGILEPTPTGYRTTDYGTTLCADADNGLTNLLHLNRAGGRAELAFVELLHSITTGEAAYPHHHGQDFWTDLANHPHLRESFDQQMIHRLQAQIPQIVSAYDWSHFSTIVDVGGGPGTLLAAILAAHPHLRGHLVDLPPAATEATKTFRAHDIEDRAQTTPASFFDPLPPGADAYLLCDILHNWPDDQAHQILARCTEAAHPETRILVIEPVGDRHANTEFDLAMLVIFGSRDRRLDEFRTLAEPHGLTLHAVKDLTTQRCLLDFRQRPEPQRPVAQQPEVHRPEAQRPE